MEKYIVYADWLIKGMPCEPYKLAKHLENLGYITIPVSKLDSTVFNNKKCIIIFFTFLELDISKFKTNNNIIIYRIDDLFPYFEMSKKCVDACDFIVGPQAHIFHKIANENLNTKPNFHLIYSAVPEFYETIQYNKDPICKVFVSGAQSFHYPLREHIRTDPKFTKYIETLDHPGYIQSVAKFSHNIIHDKYYLKLNKYLCCFCDGMLYGYFLPKIFEITSVGSLLLMEDNFETHLNAIGFYNNINCIFCNKSNLLEKIIWILDPVNRLEIDKIRQEGMNLTRANHTINNRALALDSFVTKIIENK